MVWAYTTPTQESYKFERIFSVLLIETIRLLVIRLERSYASKSRHLKMDTVARKPGKRVSLPALCSTLVVPALPRA